MSPNTELYNNPQNQRENNKHNCHKINKKGLLTHSVVLLQISY